jgi:hypothetical protein
MQIDEEMIRAQCLVLLVALRDNGPTATGHSMFCNPTADKALSRLLRSGWVEFRNGKDAVYLTQEGEDESPLATL